MTWSNHHNLILKGDSGGPLTVKQRTTQKHELVGVVSWGVGCAAVRILCFSGSFGHLVGDDCGGDNVDIQDGLAGVYAEVAKLRGWIDTKIAANGGATFCA